MIFILAAFDFSSSLIDSFLFNSVLLWSCCPLHIFSSANGILQPELRVCYGDNEGQAFFNNVLIAHRKSIVPARVSQLVRICGSSCGLRTAAYLVMNSAGSLSGPPTITKVIFWNYIIKFLLNIPQKYLPKNLISKGWIFFSSKIPKRLEIPKCGTPAVFLHR